MSKPFLTYQQQIQKLKSQKHLIIADEEFAEQKLKEIGYFSLIGGYKTLFIDPMTRLYHGDTAFEDICALYDFDRDLRELTFRYLIEIEQKIRQLISYSFCSYFGEQQSFYLSPKSYNPSPKIASDVSKLIQQLNHIANVDVSKAYLIHYRRVYHNVPLWVATKALTFGQLSKFYSFLIFGQQSVISMEYEHLTEKNLERYLSCLTIFRNACAHNEKLFNLRLQQRDFPDTILHKKLGIAQKGTQYLQGKKDYFGLVIAFRYLLPRTVFCEFKRGLIRLIQSYTKKSSRISESTLFQEMGMPLNWINITKYRI